MKRGTWIFLAILLAGTILRCIAISSRGIIYDDAFSIFLAERPLPEIITGTAADTMPPLYYFLLHFWMGLGKEIWVIRLLSVFLSLGSIPLLFYLVKRLVNEEAGLWAAFLLAINPISIYHAQDVRMYALVSLLQLGYGVFFARLYTRGENDSGKHPWDWIGLVFTGSLAMYSHNLAIFGLIVPDLLLLLQKRWKLLFRLIAAQVLIGILFLPWLVYVPGQLQKIQTAFWTPSPGIPDMINAVIMTVTTLPLPSTMLPIALGLSLGAVLLSYFAVIKNLQNRNNVYLISYGLLLPALLFLVSYVMRPVFVPRGFLLAILIFLGVGGTAISINKSVLSKALLTGLFVVGAAISLPYQITYDEFPRSQFRDMTTYLSTNIHEGEVVLYENKLSFFPARFYDRNLPQVFLADVPKSPNDTFARASQEAMQIFPEDDIQQATAGKNGVYFVVFQTSLDEYTFEGKLQHPQLTWLEENFRLQNVSKFNDLNLFFFEP